MPIYEFECQNCHRKVTLLLGINEDYSSEQCPYCQSKSLKKLVSRFKRVRSEDDRIDELAGKLEDFGEPDSPRQMREMVREMGKAMDEDMADDMEEMFESDMEEDEGATEFPAD